MGNILGIDQSTTCTGFSVYEGDILKAYGMVDLSKYNNTKEKINVIKHQIADLITEYDITFALFEDVFFDGNPQSFGTLNKLLGVLEDTCYELNVTSGAIFPSSWRSKLGLNKGVKGKGSREKYKEKAIRYVENTFGITGNIDDIAEAICIGKVASMAMKKVNIAIDK